MPQDSARYIEMLESNFGRSQGSGIEKVFRAPARLIYSKLMEKFCERSGMAMKARCGTFWGGNMTVVFPELVSCFIFRYGFFERNLSTIVLTYLKQGMTFFDVGTHFGYFTLLASEIVGPSGSVHSFEPTPSTFSVLGLNIRGRDNTRANNVAAWSCETELEFQDYGVQYSAFNSIYGAKFQDILKKKIVPATHTVKAISLDRYVEDNRAAPDFIKIDAESAEYDILEGMGKILSGIRPVITIEVGDFDPDVFKDSRESVQYLLKRDYRAFEYANGCIFEHKARDTYLYNNILFIPEEKI